MREREREQVDVYFVAVATSAGLTTVCIPGAQPPKLPSESGVGIKQSTKIINAVQAMVWLRGLRGEC